MQRAGGRLHVQDAKTEDSKNVLPLPKITRATLERHRDLQDKKRVDLAEDRQEHGLVFPSEIGTPVEPRNLSRHFASLRPRADLESMRLHDLRHTVVSVLMDLGIPPTPSRPSPGIPTSRSRSDLRTQGHARSARQDRRGGCREGP